MTNWRSRKIKDLPILIIDGDRSARYPKRAEFQKEGVLFLNTTNIEANRLNLDEANFISPAKFEQIQKGRLQPLDVVMTTRGSVGKVALFDGRFSTGLINAQMLILRANRRTIDSRFLFYLLCSQSVQQTIRNFASGSAQPQIPIQDLREIEISYPTFEIQQEIVSILSAYDGLTENNTRRIKVLEEMVRLIYEEWFVKFRFPGHEKIEKVESKLGPIPAGWEVKKLGDIAQEIRRTVSPNEIDPQTPYVGLEHIPRKSIALSEWGTAKQVQSTKLRFKRGEILFGKIRPYFHKVAIAPVDGVCSSDAIVISSRIPEYFGIVLGCVSSEEFIAHATQTSQGTKMPRANWDVLTKYPVAVPPSQLLSCFDALIRQMLDQVRIMVLRNRNLRSTRDLLLPRLISGELDVENLEIFVPETVSNSETAAVSPATL